jgi:hypothetical protein
MEKIKQLLKTKQVINGLNQFRDTLIKRDFDLEFFVLENKV